MEISNSVENDKNINKYVKLKKIGLYFLGPVLISLALVSTAFWCITAVFRDAIAYPLVCNFENFKIEYGIAEFYNRLRSAFIDFFLTACLLPIQLVCFCISLLPLLFLWVKSAVVGLLKLADYIFSKNDKILVSNRLKVVTPKLSSKYNGREEGSYVKTRIEATLGYTLGLYNFDVASKNVYVEADLVEKTILKESNINSREIPILERKRSFGSKWY